MIIELKNYKSSIVGRQGGCYAYADGHYQGCLFVSTIGRVHFFHAPSQSYHEMPSALRDAKACVGAIISGQRALSL